MKQIFLFVCAAFLMASCDEAGDKEQGSVPPEPTEQATIQLDLSVPDIQWGVETASTRAAGDAASFVGHLRLLIFDASNKLAYDTAWTDVATLSYPVTFNAVNGMTYKFVVLANTDIAGSLTSPLVRNTNVMNNTYAYMNRLTNVPATANGDSGERYGVFKRAGNADNHIFYGMTSQAVNVGSANTIPVTIKRLIAQVNLTVDIQNTTFQPMTATDPAFASSLYFDLSRMAVAMDMTPAQAPVKPTSGYTDCVVRGGAFAYTSTGYQYKATAYVFGNGKNAFVSFGVKTQKNLLAADNTTILLPAASQRLFWIDITGPANQILPNKVYNITATLPAGNMGGDPTDPGTVNPENPEAKNANLTVNVTIQDWDAPIVINGNLN